MAFCAGGHLFVKTLADAGVTFPADRDTIASALGTRTVQITEQRTVCAADIVSSFPVTYFHNGAEFWNSFTAASARGLPGLGL